MPPEEPSVKSPLDKPLHLLTDDDISQLTREDCRRFLKQKGMRRPSWNKSQAIQQVISLKKLLETTPDSETAHRSSNDNINTNSSPRHVAKRTSAVDNVGASVPVQFKEKDLENSSELSSRVVAVDNVSSPPRTTDLPDMPVGQMTIFYCGKVNVYDDVPVDKARTIMHLAASPLYFSEDSPVDGTMTVRSSACQLQGATVGRGSESAMVLLPLPQPVRTSESHSLYGEATGGFNEDNTVEGPGNRKASVQRYLEKRKDRFKSKRKIASTSSASLDIYLNNQIGSQILTEHTVKGSSCSTPHIRPPGTPTRCSSAENNVVQDAKSSAPLDEKDTKE